MCCAGCRSINRRKVERVGWRYGMGWDGSGRGEVGGGGKQTLFDDAVMPLIQEHTTYLAQYYTVYIASIIFV